MLLKTIWPLAPLLRWPVLLVSVSFCHAHMEMMQPPPIKSSFNPFYNYLTIDYSYNNPLGTDFPCKGYYKSEPRTSVANYSVGMPQTLRIFGDTDHQGGSCQVSLSYDEGQTFTVIKSFIGGCPINRTYEFIVPETSPNGQALLSWSWINHEGNRDFYQNCAWVNVVNNDTRITKESFHQQGPDMFVAGLPGQCVVLENYDFVYPDPGYQVEYGGAPENYTTVCATCMDGNMTMFMGINSRYDLVTRQTCVNLPEESTLLELPVGEGPQGEGNKEADKNPENATEIPVVTVVPSLVSAIPGIPGFTEVLGESLSAILGTIPSSTTTPVIYRRSILANESTLRTEYAIEPTSGHYSVAVEPVEFEPKSTGEHNDEKSEDKGEQNVDLKVEQKQEQKDNHKDEHIEVSPSPEEPQKTSSLGLLSKNDRPPGDTRDPRDQCEQCILEDPYCEGSYGASSCCNHRPPPPPYRHPNRNRGHAYRLPHHEHAERPHYHPRPPHPRHRGHQGTHYGPQRRPHPHQRPHNPHRGHQRGPQRRPSYNAAQPGCHSGRCHY